MGRLVVLAQALQGIEKILGIAQVCKIGRCRDDDFVGFRQHATGPFRPDMRHIKNGDRGGALEDFHDRREGLRLDVVGPVEHGWRCEHGKMIRAAGQKTIQENLVQAFGRVDRFCDPLRRVLIEVDIGGTVGQVEIGQDHRRRKEAGNAPGAVVRDRR